MKKIFTFLIIALLAGNLTFGQIIFSQIYEGSSGFNKHIELTNVGTSSVDLANPQLTLKLFSNKVDIGTNTPTSTYNLSGTLVAGQVYVLRHTSATTPAYALTVTPSDTISSVTSFNGTGSTSNPTGSTDIIALYNGTTLVDVFSYGTFQYKDQSYYRNQNITVPNATWTVGEWTLATLTDVDNAATNTLPRLGYHTTSTVPYLNISTPVSGATYYNTSVNVVFSVGNFSIPSSGHIHYTVDGGANNIIYDTNPISLTGLSIGSHTVSMKLVDPNHADLNPAVTATTTFTIATPTDVANLAALRASAIGSTVYRVTGEVILTFQQSNTGHPKYVQDATGGILIYDASNIITTVYNQYDGIKNLTGTLSDYNGMLEFAPVSDPGTAFSTGNTVTPIPLTLTELNDNPTFLSRQAQLVKISNVTFGTTGSFANGKGYKITASADSFYTNFYSVDYIGLTIPANSVNIIGLLGTRIQTGNFITARNLADIEGMNGINAQTVSNEVSVFPNPAKESVTINNLKNVNRIEVSNILGQVINSYSNLTKEEINISFAGFNKGIYFISVIENNGIAKTMKLIKE